MPQHLSGHFDTCIDARLAIGGEGKTKKCLDGWINGFAIDVEQGPLEGIGIRIGHAAIYGKNTRRLLIGHLVKGGIADAIATEQAQQRRCGIAVQGDEVGRLAEVGTA
jgi:hypothetical protein